MLKHEKWKIIVPFVMPGFVLYTVFSIYPAVRGLIVSFFKWSGMTPQMEFVGLANYAKLWQQLTDPIDFYNVRTYLSHNAFLFVFSLIGIFLALGVAMVISNRPFGASLFRVTYFFPNVLSTSAIAVLWSMVLNPTFGLMNVLLERIGLGALALPWLSLDYEMPLFRLGLYTVGAIGIWSSLGWYMILFLAAIQNIPIELLEAARLDGASESRVFWSVVAPLIWETLRTVLVLAVIGALSQFALVFVLFMQWPNKHSDLIMNYYYYQAFREYNWGYASAIVGAVFLVTIIASVLAHHVLGRETVQY